MRLFLACIGSLLRNYVEQAKQADYILESFYYVAPWEIPLIKHWKMFLLDSGAFTFMNTSSGKIDWDEYLTKYIKFINEYQIQYFFELDIDCIVGIKEVERLRKRLENETGKQSIPVWHFNRGKDYFIRMCEEYNYVAFGGIITDGIKNEVILKNLPWFVKTAHSHNCKLHALGLTCKNIEKYGVDSVDSTSWSAGGRYGHIYHFNGTMLQQFSKPKNKRLIDYKEVNIHNFREWVKYAKFLDK